MITVTDRKKIIDPYPSEHAARLTDPKQYTEWARENVAPGIDIILGIKAGKSERQAIRFKKEKFTVAQAKTWLKEHKIKPILFEPAKENGSDSIDVEIYGINGDIMEEYHIDLDELQDADLKNNSKAKIFLNSLISTGKINNDAWSFTAADGNKLLGDNGDNWEQYSKVHLAINPDAEPGTKNYYMFPVAKMVGDQIQIFRRGIIAAKTVAAGGRGAPKRENIMKLADSLLSAIDKKLGKDSDDNTIHHFDVFDETRLLFSEKAQKTPEGFLKGRAIATNTGIFNYMKQDGTMLRELRDTDEVMKWESLQTLKNKPMTMLHPENLVTADNIQELQRSGKIIGYTGSGVQNDGHVVSVDYIITNIDAINKIESGEMTALSCGYQANLDFSQTGMAFGNNQYDCIQKDIVYNHVALVPQGRAGDLAKIRMDNIADNVAIQIIDKKQKEVNMPENVNTTVFKIDGIDYTIDRDIAKFINLLQKKIEDADVIISNLTKEKTEIEAKKDAAESQVSDLTKKLEESNLDDSQLLTAVNERVELTSIADSLKVEYKKDATNKEIKLAIIKSKSDKIDLTNKDDNYINAYFDSIKDIVKSEIENTANNNNKKKVMSDYVNNDNNQQLQKTKQQMYDEYVERIKKQSENYKGSASIVNGEVVVSN